MSIVGSVVSSGCGESTVGSQTQLCARAPLAGCPTTHPCRDPCAPTPFALHDAVDLDLSEVMVGSRSDTTNPNQHLLDQASTELDERENFLRKKEGVRKRGWVNLPPLQEERKGLERAEG